MVDLTTEHSLLKRAQSVARTSKNYIIELHTHWTGDQLQPVGATVHRNRRGIFRHEHQCRQALRQIWCCVEFYVRKASRNAHRRPEAVIWRLKKSMLSQRPTSAVVSGNRSGRPTMQNFDQGTSLSFYSQSVVFPKYVHMLEAGLTVSLLNVSEITSVVPSCQLWHLPEPVLP